MKRFLDPEVDRYAAEHSTQPGELLRELEQYTYDHLENPGMVVGGLEGAFLKMLVRLLDARRALEIGLFTGYSALCMAEAMSGEGKVISCELEEKHAKVARSFIERSPVGHRIDIHMGPALESLKDIDGPFDLVFLDADKENYCNYYDAVLPKLRSGGLIAADNVLWSGRVLDPKEESDRALVAFNSKVHADPNVENVLVTLRDGVMLVRKI